MTSKGFFMKKIIFIALLSGLAVATQAQHARFGVQAGGMLTTANRNSKGISNLENKFARGVYAGGLVEFSFKRRTDKFKLQLEAYYSYMTIGHSYTLAGENRTDMGRAHMLSIPVLAKYFFTPSFSLYAGPAVSYNISSREETTGTTDHSGLTPIADYDVNIFQLGGVMGVNYYICKGLFVAARYHALITDYYKSEVIKAGRRVDYGTIHNFQLGVGYKF